MIDKQIPNADYGIFVQSKDEGANGVTASAYSCAYSVNNNNPIWGTILWNLRYFKYDLLGFQANVNTGIH